MRVWTMNPTQMSRNKAQQIKITGFRMDVPAAPTPPDKREDGKLLADTYSSGDHSAIVCNSS
jgi:hypothetical protein